MQELELESKFEIRIWRGKGWREKSTPTDEDITIYPDYLPLTLKGNEVPRNAK